MAASVLGTIPPEHTAFWTELGRFISYYSIVEEQINFLVRKYYNISRRISNIAFGTLRYDAAVEHLNRLRHADLIPDDEWAEIGNLKDQMGLITRLRNDLVHYPASPTSKSEFVVSTKLWAYVENKIRMHIVSTQILDDATTDLFKIFMRLTILHRPGERAAFEQLWGALLREPWRYKPLAPTSPYPTRPSSRRGRRNRRAPSPK
jgi:hypothetical protein